MTVFIHMAQGIALWQRVEAASVAAANVHMRPTAAEAIVTDPQSATLLPIFGHRLQTAPVRDTNAFGGVRQATYWQTVYPFSQFWTRLRTQLRTALTTTAHADGTVRQHLTTDTASTVWVQACTDTWDSHDHLLTVYGPDRSVPRPTTEHAPFHVAAALAAIGGIPWTVSADGTLVERVLPAQPLRHLPADIAHPHLGQLKNKLLFPCVGWAYLPANSTANEEGEHVLVYLSAVGPHKKLKAVWAALMDTKRDLLVLPSRTDAVRARRPDGKGVFDTFWNDEPLPDSGLAHLVIQHRSMMHPRSGQPFLHLTGEDGLPDLALFARQLDAASTYPIQREWVEQLWHAGIEYTLITALPSYGCAAFWVNVHDEAAWGDLIAQRMGAQTAIVETYGSDPTDAPQVADVETAA